MINQYYEYLESRKQANTGSGFKPLHIPDSAFPFQSYLIDWAVRQGRGAIFADCGMGKTLMELAWAENVVRHTGRPVLIATPLAVAHQMVKEAEKFGYNAAISRSGKVAENITITNYEQLEKFDELDFAGIVCDESSILKNFGGATKARVTEFARKKEYRLLGTATAAPNDYAELGTSSEALGYLGYMDMLTRFFVNKNNTKQISSRGGRDSAFILKPHAVTPFWRYVATWARAIRTPSDYGFDDGGFVLPPLNVETHTVSPGKLRTICEVPAVGLREEREDTRLSLPERCEKAAELLSDVDYGVAWCNLNDESELLTKLIPGAVELRGSEEPEAKEEKLRAFSDGDIRVLVTKPKIGAWGLNWQHAANMTYFVSHSYEQYYQAVRRMWRFGQQRPVKVHVISSTTTQGIIDSLDRKHRQMESMFDALVQYMRDALTIKDYEYDKEAQIPTWLIA
jgi:hypothetical protein